MLLGTRERDDAHALDPRIGHLGVGVWVPIEPASLGLRAFYVFGSQDVAVFRLFVVHSPQPRVE